MPSLIIVCFSVIFKALASRRFMVFRCPSLKYIVLVLKHIVQYFLPLVCQLRFDSGIFYRRIFPYNSKMTAETNGKKFENFVFYLRVAIMVRLKISDVNISAL